MPSTSPLPRTLYALFMATFLIAGTASAQCPTLVWSDEFDGNAVNEGNWSYQTGGSGWGNNELQYYRPQNATVESGVLKITAREQKYRGKNYTSTRMRTLNKADFTYGHFEARIKMTTGQGIWPAFWMMPTDDVYGGWPKSGEIDIMENVGHEPSTTHGTIHYGDPSHVFSGASFRLFGGQRFTDDFHTFAIEKDPNEIRWYVDGVHFYTRTPADIAPEFWPFEERYHFILNVAVGGNWPGSPDATTVFPQVLEVDYVRVYDGNFPSIGGDRQVSSEQAGVVYSVANAPAGTTYSWSVPSGASIVAGQGTSSVTVDWGEAGGNVTAALNNTCGASQLAINVDVEPPVTYDFSFENFDDPPNATVSSNTGTLTEIANPDTSGINPSALVGEYVRNSGELYDTLFYTTTAIPDASEYADGTRKLLLDVYTTAPVGTEVLIQLEDSTSATGTNYPTGRHSRYQTFTSVQNGWERLEVGYLDSPDGALADTAVDNLVILFAPNTQTGDTWIFDNLDSYTAGDPPPPPPLDPPAAPSSLVALSAGTTQIDLSWNDNSNNESGFKIERSLDGVNFSQIATTGSNTTTYSDSGLASATTYHYQVRATNADGDSAYSNTDSATTDSVNPSTSMSVSSVVAGVQNAGQGNKRGMATVTIVDGNGNPVAGATVSGDFASNHYNEPGSGVTGADGSVVIVTAATAKGGVTVTFCVDDVTHASLTYDPASNVMTCDSL